MKTKLLHITPVLPSTNIKRDVDWYKTKTGFTPIYFDEMYAVLIKDNLHIHLQWHANTKEDPLLGGSVIKIFVEDIEPFYLDFVKRKTIIKEKLKISTPWQTNEFGFFDLNKNAIFIVESLH